MALSRKRPAMRSIAATNNQLPTTNNQLQSMLRWRIVMAVVIVAVLAVLCWWDCQVQLPGSVLFPLALVVTAAATSELVAMFAASGTRPASCSVYAATLLTVAAGGVPIYWPTITVGCPLGKMGWPLLGLTAALLPAFLGEMRRFGESNTAGQATTNLGRTMLSGVYVGVLMSFVVQLRLMGFGAGGGDPRWGMVALLSLVVVVKSCDVGAYTVGRLVGRRKLAPRLSPGKTWEGVIGGLVLAVIGSCLMFGIVVPMLKLGTIAAVPSPSGPVRWIVFGLLVGAAGVVGDLAESLLKRDAGCKDSGRSLPGFGGVLDLLDSILGGAPVAYVLWASGFVGPG